jgi:ankyrin repeat protein
MNELIQAVIKQDVAFLKKNLTSKTVNANCDFPVIQLMNVHLLDGTERTDSMYVDEQGTLLHITAWYNLPRSAEVLVEKGADINAKDAQGRTPLEVAVNNRSSMLTDPVQRVLIEHGADMNFYVTAYFLNEPLLFAYIHWGKFELATLAIEHGADVNMKTNGRTTIIEFAEERGTPALVEKLKAKGAKGNDNYLKERERELEEERLNEECLQFRRAQDAEQDKKNQENSANNE